MKYSHPKLTSASIIAAFLAVMLACANSCPSSCPVLQCRLGNTGLTPRSSTYNTWPIVLIEMHHQHSRGLAARPHGGRRSTGIAWAQLGIQQQVDHQQRGTTPAATTKARMATRKPGQGAMGVSPCRQSTRRSMPAQYGGREMNIREVTGQSRGG